MIIHSSDCKVIPVPLSELSEGAGHRKRQGFDVANLLPEIWVGALLTTLLVCKELEICDGAGVWGRFHVPRKNNTTGSVILFNL